MPSFGGVLISLACIYPRGLRGLPDFLSIFYPKDMHGLLVPLPYCLPASQRAGFLWRQSQVYLPSSTAGLQRFRAPKRSSFFAERSLKLTEPFERTFSVPLPVQVVKNASDYQITLALFPEGLPVTAFHSPDAVHSTITVTAFQEAWGSSSEPLWEPAGIRHQIGLTLDSLALVLTIKLAEFAFRLRSDAFPPELQHLVKLQSQDAYLPIISASRLSFKGRPGPGELHGHSRLLTLRFEPVSIGSFASCRPWNSRVESLKKLSAFATPTSTM
uniref:Mannosidase alpha class 2C member 1 n=1 Tax=Macrostomum lignano TaxID=282301 RepID=A0A1I8FRZ9_9PLAT